MDEDTVVDALERQVLSLTQRVAELEAFVETIRDRAPRVTSDEDDA